MTTPVRLDNRGTPCAVGLIRTDEVMKDLPPGSILELLSRDHFAPMEVELWAERDGHRLLSTARAGIWPFRYYRFLLKKAASGEDQPAADD